jgi:diphthine-ammonia ligase
VNAFVSWSGGKETALAFYKIVKETEIAVVRFLNMVNQNGKRSRSHGVSSEMLRVQAEAIGIPVTQVNCTWENYEENFKKAVLNLKQQDGINAGVFGDIDISGHRDWVEKVCEETGIRPFLPLWKKEREVLLNMFIQEGFKAVVIAADKGKLGESWLGR